MYLSSYAPTSFPTSSDPFGPGGFDPGGPGGYPTGGGTVSSPLNLFGFELPGGLSWDQVRGWLDLAEDAKELWERIVSEGGGGLRWSGRYCEGRNPVADPCPGTPDFEAIYRAVKAMPEADIQWILHGLGSIKEGPAPASRADLLDRPNLPTWVCGIMGGHDCAHTTSGARQAWPEPYFPPDVHFAELVAEYGAPTIFSGGPGDIFGGEGASKAAMLVLGAGLIFALLRARSR